MTATDKKPAPDAENGGANDAGNSGAFATKSWLQHYASWTPHHLDYGNTTLLDVYEHNLARFASRHATYFFGRQLSFEELDEQVQQAAAGLAALGVRRGDRVAILLPNCPQHVVAFWALQRLGAVAVEHNPLYTAHELRGQFADHGARVAIVWDKAVAKVAEKLRSDNTTALETIISVNMVQAMPRTKQLVLAIPLPQIRKMRAKLTEAAPGTISFEQLLRLSSPAALPPRPELSKDDNALILYTSGTTGTPKGAQLSHGNLYANILQGRMWVENLGTNGEQERMLAALPAFHAYGLTMSFTLQMIVGGELILLPSPQLDLIMEIMKKYPPTWLPGVPTLYERIVDEARKQNIPLNGIRNAFSGASTLPVSTVNKWEAATGGCLVEGYGLTETSPVIVGNPMNGNRRPGYVGVPFPDTEVRIADPENLDNTQPDGVEGEVLVRGPQVFKGYLNQPEATAESFHDGWYRTGDVGIMEADGFIRLVARIKEVIITGGFNVYPVEVEETLREHPDIEEIAVVGLPREDGSESVVACVTLEEGAALDPEGLKEFARERLTRYKVPRTFYHFEELARDQMGKIRRREVQEQLLTRLAKQKNPRG
ncbi:long-chain-fatty-acid--CoA ligase [Corynebacterium caspium]|uniref:long-chain-fatty-acid--CoA ligase n=1 Tax=Corynebacterium caspium TaxID=234828 RepID=UPI0003746A05|nr:long-chain-fatty-acid--CoA ligase [Corynebacterium caspium]WKD59922.1 Long-chain-fatty-acid--CoA ligase [Corynebacterium caspium DSM 44850]